jgi:hypothetical protein
LQQLFVMNSAFIREQAARVAKAASAEVNVSGQVRTLYRKTLARDPTSKEMDMAVTYLKDGSAEEYAQVLLASNEGIFWP